MYLKTSAVQLNNNLSYMSHGNVLSSDMGEVKKRVIVV